MAIIEYKETCALCGQPVEIKGFTLTTLEAVQKFCCAGCLSLYQLLNKNTIIITSTPLPKNEDI
jgi:hypothetical protein